MWDMAVRDFRHAARSLARSPGFSATAVLSLAIGVGASAAIFSLVDQVLFRLLPVREPERLVAAWTTSSNLPEEPVSLPDFRDWREGAREAVTLAAVDWSVLDLTPEGAEPVQLQSAAVRPLRALKMVEHFGAGTRVITGAVPWAPTRHTSIAPGETELRVVLALGSLR